MHNFHGVDTVIFRVSCNINSGKATSPALINEFVALFNDAVRHCYVAVHQTLRSGYPSAFRRREERTATAVALPCGRTFLVGTPKPKPDFRPPCRCTGTITLRE